MYSLTAGRSVEVQDSGIRPIDRIPAIVISEYAIIRKGVPCKNDEKCKTGNVQSHNGLLCTWRSTSDFSDVMPCFVFNGL